MKYSRSNAILGAVLVLGALAVLISPLGAVSKDRSSDLMLDQEFALGSGGKLVIKAADIDFEIRTGAGSTSSVKLYVSGKNREKAEEYFEKLNFDASLDGDVLVLQTRKKNVKIVNFWNTFRNTRAWAVVAVPEKIDVEIKTEDGDIILEDIVGNASICTEDGDIDLSGITGSSIKIVTEDGDVEADLLDGDRVTVRSEDGDVEIETLESGDVKIKTEDGDLVIDQLNGDLVNLSSEDGDVQVERINGDQIVIRTEDGDITLSVSGNSLDGRCEDGDVKINLLKEMETIFIGEDGDIILTVPKDSGADLDLSGENLHLKSKIAVQGKVSKKRIKGTLNKGGKLIKIRVSDGTIIFSEK